MTPEDIRKTALENIGQFKGSAKKQTRALKELIQKHELVFGVFPDGDYVVIKGQEKLSAIVQSGLAGGLTWTSILCGQGPDEATAMRMTFGDGAIAH